MPEPHGTDRLSLGPDGRFVLLARDPKGWRPRLPATRTSAEHPGTAVRWGGEIWEVLELDETKDGRWKYTLAPWDDAFAIRSLVPYDEEAETARAAERRAQRKSAGIRVVALATAPLAGLLPGRIQELLELEHGVRSTLLTAASLPIPLAVGTYGLVTTFAAAFAPLLKAAGPVGDLLTAGLVYFFVESLVRLAVLFAQGRPIGSVVGVPLGLAARAARLLPSEPGIVPTGPSPEQSLRDRHAMLEPLLSFLRPDEQAALKRRFGFDPLRWGRVTAWGLLLYPALTLPAQLAALAGGRTGGRGLAVLALSLAVVAEQLWRLRKIGRGEGAASLLGHLVRPFAAPLLAAASGPT